MAFQKRASSAETMFEAGQFCEAQNFLHAVLANSIKESRGLIFLFAKLM